MSRTTIREIQFFQKFSLLFIVRMRLYPDLESRFLFIPASTQPQSVAPGTIPLWLNHIRLISLFFAEVVTSVGDYK